MLLILRSPPQVPFFFKMCAPQTVTVRLERTNPYKVLPHARFLVTVITLTFDVEAGRFTLMRYHQISLQIQSN